MVHFTTVLSPWYHQCGMYHGFWGGTFVTWYVMVQLITMVQMYHPKNYGTLNHGSATMVQPC
jgi:hypothetical protein